MPAAEIATAVAGQILANVIQKGVQWTASRITDRRQSHFEKQLASVALSAGLDAERHNHIVTINDPVPTNLLSVLLPPPNTQLSPDTKTLILYNVADAWLKHSFRASCACDDAAGKLYQTAGAAAVNIPELVSAFGNTDKFSPVLCNELQSIDPVVTESCFAGDAVKIPHAITRDVLKACPAARATTSRNIVFGFLLQAVLACRGVQSMLQDVQYANTTVFETDLFKTLSVAGDPLVTLEVKSRLDNVLSAVQIIRDIWGEGIQGAPSADADEVFSQVVYETNKVETLYKRSGKSWIEVLKSCTHKPASSPTLSVDEIAMSIIDRLRKEGRRCIAGLDDIRLFMGYGATPEQSNQHFESYDIDLLFYERHSDLIRSYVVGLKENDVLQLQQMDLRSQILRNVIAQAKAKRVTFIDASKSTLLPRSIHYLLTRESLPWLSRRQTIAVNSKSLAIATPVLSSTLYMECGARTAARELPAVGERADDGPYLVAVLLARLLVDLGHFPNLKFASRIMGDLTALPPSDVKSMMADLMKQRIFERSAVNTTDLLRLSEVSSTANRLFNDDELAVKATFRAVCAILEQGIAAKGSELRCACANELFDDRCIPGLLMDAVLEFRDLVRLQTESGELAVGFFRGGRWEVKATLNDMGRGVYHAERVSERQPVTEESEPLSGHLG